ncbi:hypothetical protein BDN72DRAFT_874903 [Pluteus cervinus]|uniref:Uncharacterized protein n=1 Tax=Pluteus cervinus TaxID=181527 RepID=A0ACD3BAI6_9AGAR|nr:hypothetical protein BDN72DRAFT_874903 [Pluteus cervinus]
MGSGKRVFNRKEHLRQALAKRWAKETVIPAKIKMKPAINYEKRFRNEHRKNMRLTARNKELQARIKDLEGKNRHTEAKLTSQHKEFNKEHTQATNEVKYLRNYIEGRRKDLAQSKKVIRALEIRCSRAPSRKRALVQTNSMPRLIRLKKNGMYTPMARTLIRILVQSGCSANKVPELIPKISQLLGIRITPTKISRRTVQRSIVEGGVAASLQTGYELTQAESLTISQDSTSHRKINYEARHIAVRAPNYEAGETSPSPTSTPSMRLLGVDATVDHSSETSIQGWTDKLSGITAVWNESPLMRRTTGQDLTLRHFLKLLKGMNGDHANNEKLTASMFQQLKTDETIQELGEKALSKKPPVELLLYLMQWTQKKLNDVGGLEAWEALSSEEQLRRDEQLIRDIREALGQEEYDKLPADERRALDFFVWVGCCMHKDQNSFAGGNTEMMAWWEKNGETPPLLLANKQNAETLRKVLDPARGNAPLTDSEEAALKATTRGGVKAAAIAGAIFNNRDDKRGQGDSHVYHFIERIGDAFRRFPDTNNTRFGSHALAAEQLLIYLDETRQFLELIKDKKKKPAWTNIELNLHKALDDDATLTEFAVLGLNNQVVTVPYIREVRKPGVNALDLGELHKKVKTHIQNIINNPDLLLGDDVSHHTATLDGKDWENPLVIKAIQKLKPRLPHLRSVLVAFMTGALATWNRFTSEYAPGGLIDIATVEERRLAWVPATNDENEGALGAIRIYWRLHPRITAHLYNALATYTKNNTQAFMDAMLTQPEDHIFLMRKARELDSSGLEAKRRKEQVKHDLEVAQKAREKAALKQAKKEERFNHLIGLKLVTDLQELDKLVVAELNDQLDIWYELAGDKEVPTRSKRGRKADKQNLVRQALERCLERTGRERNELTISVIQASSLSPIEPEPETAVEEEDEDMDQAERGEQPRAAALKTSYQFEGAGRAVVAGKTMPNILPNIKPPPIFLKSRNSTPSGPFEFLSDCCVQESDEALPSYSPNSPNQHSYKPLNQETSV